MQMKNEEQNNMWLTRDANGMCPEPAEKNREKNYFLSHAIALSSNQKTCHPCKAAFWVWSVADLVVSG
jgi:hypothetical protein